MDPRITLVISIIEKQFARELDSESLGRSVNLSASRLRHLFRAETGLTPRRYLKRLRFEAAGQLLLTTFLSVKQITNRVGINDDSYFSREFRKIYGMAPGKFRKASISRDSKSKT